jgi:alpha-beta hydrolase superfamily lysophospholipase
MLRKGCRWMKAHPRRSALLCLLAAFALLNILAYAHAHSMTHYSFSSVRTGRPESLSALEKVQALCFGVSVPRPAAGNDTPDLIGLPYTSHRLVPAQGVALDAWHIPHPSPHGHVVLFHGYGACKAALLPEAKELHALGYATFLVDFRGSGGSSERLTTIGMLEADDVACACDYVTRQWQPQRLLLYGRSMGSAAILRALAADRIRPQALLLECPFDTLLNTVVNRFDTMGVPSFPAAHLLVFWGGAQHGCNGFSHNPVEYALQVKCPVLVLQGEHDLSATRAQAERVFNALPGPREMEVFPEAGHESYLLCAPERWRRAVSQFLMRQVSG